MFCYVFFIVVYGHTVKSQLSEVQLSKVHNESVIQTLKIHMQTLDDS